MNDLHDNVEALECQTQPRLDRPSLPSVLLGVVIVWQLLYLPAANFIKLLPVRLPPHKGELNDEVQLRADESARGPAQSVRDGLAFGLSRWGELTGQTQGWALFAPTFGHQASLPVVTLNQRVFGLRPGQFRSKFAPSEPPAYFPFHWPWCPLFNLQHLV